MIIVLLILIIILAILNAIQFYQGSNLINDYIKLCNQITSTLEREDELINEADKLNQHCKEVLALSKTINEDTDKVLKLYKGENK